MLFVVFCDLVVLFFIYFFFCSSRRRHTRCALVTGVQTCALPISATPNGRNDLSTSNIAEKHLVDALYPFDPHRVVLAREISAYRPHLLASGQPNLDLPQHSDNLLCCIVRSCHSPLLSSAREPKLPISKRTSQV